MIISVDCGFSMCDLIPHFLEASDNWQTSSHQLFKRVAKVEMIGTPFEDWIKILHLISKASVCINKLYISIKRLKKLREVNNKIFENLKVEELILNERNSTKIDLSTAEILNQINSSTLSIYNADKSVSYFKIVSALNNKNIDISFKSEGKANLKLKFEITPIALFDWSSNNQSNYMCESLFIYATLSQFDDIILVKVKDKNHRDLNYLYFAFKWISRIEISEFKIESNEIRLDQRFPNDVLFKNDGILVPVNNLNQSMLNYWDSQLFKIFAESSDLITHILKAKHLSWEIRFINDFTKISHLVPEHYSRIKYSINSNKLWSNSWISDELDNLYQSEYSISEISIESQLSEFEFKLLSKILAWDKTRFSLSSISVVFEKLSECLEILRLCSECPELNEVNFSYFEVDVEDEQHCVNLAVQELNRKVGFVERIRVYKETNYDSLSDWDSAFNQ